MLVFFALGNEKVLSFALGDAKVPNANSFASQWNIGLTGEQGTQRGVQSTKGEAQSTQCETQREPWNIVCVRHFCVGSMLGMSISCCLC